MKKKWFVVAVGALVVTAGGFWWSASRSRAVETATTRTVVVDKGPVRLVVNASGKISPNFEVDIKCKASGEVINLPYDVSDNVKKGALVLELDPIDEQRSVNNAKAATQAAQWKLDSSRHTLEIAKKTYDTDKDKAQIALRTAEIAANDQQSKTERMRQLLQSKLVSSEDAETSETALLRAQAAVDDAKNALAALEVRPLAIEMDANDVNLSENGVETANTDLLDAEERLKETKVFAPIDGVVTTRPAQIGTIVSSGITNVGGGTSVMTLCDLSRLFVLVPVDEADIGKVKLDQKVVIRCDAYADKKFEGKILRISPKGLTQNGVVTFDVKIEVLGEGKEFLKPEMSADIEIVVGEKSDVVRVASEAVQMGKDKERYVLLPIEAAASGPASTRAPAIGSAPASANTSETAIASSGRSSSTATAAATKPADEKTVKRIVEVGLDDGTNCEIISGLKVGDKVVIPSAQQGQWSKVGDDMFD